jgi:hypothetical protein
MLPQEETKIQSRIDTIQIIRTILSGLRASTSCRVEPRYPVLSRQSRLNSIDAELAQLQNRLAQVQYERSLATTSVSRQPQEGSIQQLTVTVPAHRIPLLPASTTELAPEQTQSGKRKSRRPKRYPRQIEAAPIPALNQKKRKREVIKEKLKEGDIESDHSDIEESEVFERKERHLRPFTIRCGQGDQYRPPTTTRSTNPLAMSQNALPNQSPALQLSFLSSNLLNPPEPEASTSYFRPQATQASLHGLSASPTRRKERSEVRLFLIIMQFIQLHRFGPILTQSLCTESFSRKKKR